MAVSEVNERIATSPDLVTRVLETEITAAVQANRTLTYAVLETDYSDVVVGVVRNVLASTNSRYRPDNLLKLGERTYAITLDCDIEYAAELLRAIRGSAHEFLNEVTAVEWTPYDGVNPAAEAEEVYQKVEQLRQAKSMLAIDRTVRPKR